MLLGSFWLDRGNVAEVWQLLATLVLSIWILFYRWNHILRLPSSYFSIALLIGAATIQIWGSITWQPWLGALAIALGWVGFCVNHFNKDGVNLSEYAALGLLLVRLPQCIDAVVETNASQYLLLVASYILDLLKVANDIVGQHLVITSGVVADSRWVFIGFSLYVFVAICWLVFFRKNIWLILHYLAVAILAAFVSRLMWLVVTAKLIDATASGTLPTNVTILVDAGCLISGLLIFLSLDGLIQIVFHPIQERKAGRKVSNPLLALWDRITSALPVDGDQRREAWLSSVISNPSRKMVWIYLCVSLVMILTLVPQTWHAWQHWRTPVTQSEPVVFDESTRFDLSSAMVPCTRATLQFGLAGLSRMRSNKHDLSAKGAT